MIRIFLLVIIIIIYSICSSSNNSNVVALSSRLFSMTNVYPLNKLKIRSQLNFNLKHYKVSV